MSAPRRRASDQDWRRQLRWLIRENVYYDRVWLLVITGIAVLGVVAANNQAHRATTLARQIQAQRKETILNACRSQNARHDGTIRQLDVEIKQIARTDPARAAQAKASRNYTVQLIDALAPKQDCNRVLHAATALLAPPPPRPRHHR